MCVMDNDNLITDPSGVANSFNKYYSNIADSILVNRKYTGDGDFSKFMPAPIPNSIFIKTVDEMKLEILLKVLM